MKLHINIKKPNKMGKALNKPSIQQDKGPTLLVPVVACLSLHYKPLRDAYVAEEKGCHNGA